MLAFSGTYANQAEGALIWIGEVLYPYFMGNQRRHLFRKLYRQVN